GPCASPGFAPPTGVGSSLPKGRREQVYARVASFEGRDSSLTDQLIQRVRDQGPSAVPDAKGFLGLFDRERGTALGITFFDSEEAIRNSQQAFEDMAQNFPTEMRGRRASVDIHEVVIYDGA